jgi:hypothetical protein
VKERTSSAPRPASRPKRAERIFWAECPSAGMFDPEATAGGPSSGSHGWHSNACGVMNARGKPGVRGAGPTPPSRHPWSAHVKVMVPGTYPQHAPRTSCAPTPRRPRSTRPPAGRRGGQGRRQRPPRHRSSRWRHPAPRPRRPPGGSGGPTLHHTKRARCYVRPRRAHRCGGAPRSARRAPPGALSYLLLGLGLLTAAKPRAGAAATRHEQAPGLLGRACTPRIRPG